MKKLLIIILVVGLVFAGTVGLALHFFRPAAQSQAPADASPTPGGGELIASTPAPTQAPAETAAPAETPAPPAEAEAAHVDLEALYKLYAPETVYARVGDREILWKEYYEWLGSNILTAENYMEQMRSYGMGMAWGDDYNAGMSFADYVVNGVNDNLRVYIGIDIFAEENGVTVTEEEIDAMRAEDMRSLLGEDATEEEWAALLVQNFMTDALYRRQVLADLEVRKGMELLYGEAGEKLSEEELQAFLDESGYLRCNHILFLTVDMESSTREPLDEATIAAKKAQADSLAAELQAIGDTDELLARFSELKTALCEDSGKDYYPDGYIFQPGVMVPEFENTTRELAVYEVSDPVLSSYGYHVIVRLPIRADTRLDDGSTIAENAASMAYAARIDETVDKLDFVLAPDVGPIDLTAFLK